MRRPNRRVSRGAALLAGLAAALLAAGCGPEETVAARPQIEVPARSLDFGDVPVLVVRRLELEIRNVGRAPLLVEQVFLEPASGAFALESAPETVGPGESAFVALAFTALQLESYAATLTIRSDDEASPSIAVALAGRGLTAGGIAVPAGLELPEVCEGGEELRRLKIRSTGSAELVVERIAFAEGTAAEFAFLTSTRTPVTIPTGDELLVAIRYAPAAGAPARSEGAVIVESADPQNRRVEIPLVGTVNRAPIAVIAELPISAPGAIVALDGSGSSDPEAEALTFDWSLATSPIGSQAAPTPADAPLAELGLDLPGEYGVRLKVRDALGCVSEPALATVLAKPAEKLLVELVWDNYDADLDLHLAPEGEPFFGPLDCYFADGHMSPDWGVAGETGDDPVLDRDALTGFGPEIVTYAEPAPGRYRVMAHYFSDHGSKTPATVATVRVFVFGALRSELRQSLSREKLEWTAVSIEWPGGAITPIETVQ